MEDKIQRVIYRVVVDTAGLKEQVAAAKAEIAALNTADKNNADAAVRNAERVEKARRKAAGAYGAPGLPGEAPSQAVSAPPSSGGYDRGYHSQLNIIIAELQRIAGASRSGGGGGGNRPSPGPDFQPLSHMEAEERYHRLIGSTLPARVQAANRVVAAQTRIADALEHQADLHERANRLAEAPPHSPLPPARIGRYETTPDGGLRERQERPYYEQGSILDEIDDRIANYDPTAETYRSQSGRRRRRGRRNPPFDHARARAERLAEPDLRAGHEEAARAAAMRAINAEMRENHALLQRNLTAERGYSRVLADRVAERLHLTDLETQAVQDELRGLQERNRAATDFERSEAVLAQRRETWRDRLRRRYRAASERDPVDPELDEADEARRNVNRRTRRDRNRERRARNRESWMSETVVGQTVGRVSSGLNDIRDRLLGGDDDRVGKRFNYWKLILGAILYLVAALVPAIAVVAAALGAMFSTLTVAFSAVGVFALAAVGHIKDLQKALKDSAGDAGSLPAPYRAVAVAFEEVRKAYKNFLEATQAPVFEVFVAALNLVSRLLPRLVALVDRASTGLRGALSVFDEGFRSDGFASFLEFAEVNAPRVLVSLSRSLRDIAAGLGGLAQSFGPFIQWFLNGLEDMARGFRNWANGLASSERFQDFMDYARAQVPVVLNAVSGLVDILITLGVVLAPTGTILLNLIYVLSQFGKALSFLGLTKILIPLFQAFTAILFTWLTIAGITKLIILLRGALVTLGTVLTGTTVKAEAMTVAMRMLGAATAVLAAGFVVWDFYQKKQQEAADAVDRHSQAVRQLSDEMAANAGIASEGFKKQIEKDFDKKVESSTYWDVLTKGEHAGYSSISEQLGAAGIDKSMAVAGASGDDAARAQVKEQWDAYIKKLEEWKKRASPSLAWDIGSNIDAARKSYNAYFNDTSSAAEAASTAQTDFTGALNGTNLALTRQQKEAQATADLIGKLATKTEQAAKIEQAIAAKTKARDTAQQYEASKVDLARLRVDVPLANARAAMRVVDAETALAEAHRKSREAQLSVTEARIRAADQLQDLQNKLRDIALDEEGASIALARAEQNMRKVMSDPLSTSLDRRQALLDYQRAQRDKEDTTTESGRLRRDAPRTEREIQESVAEAERAAVESRRSVTKAETDLKDAKLAQTRAYEDGQKSLETAAQRTDDLKTASQNANVEYQTMLGLLAMTPGMLDAVISKYGTLADVFSQKLSTTGLDDIATRAKLTIQYLEARRLMDRDKDLSAAEAWALAGTVADNIGYTSQYGEHAYKQPSGNKSPPTNTKPLKTARGATGGAVRGPGTRTSDSVPYLLSNDEHIWTAAETAALGGHARMGNLRNAVLAGRFGPAEVDALASGFDPASLYAGLGATSSTRLPAMAGAGSVRSAVTNTSTHAGFNVGDVTIHNPVKEQAGESLYRAVRRLSFEYS